MLANAALSRRNFIEGATAAGETCLLGTRMGLADDAAPINRA